MKITKQELIELQACEAGLERFITQTGNTDEPVEVLSLIGGKNNYRDLLWLAGEKLSKERLVRFACDCALLNIELIKPYTDKYNMIVEFLHNPTGGDIHARIVVPYGADDAEAAGNAVYYAAVDTVDAVDAAEAAAYSAIHAATINKEKVDELLKNLFV